MMTEDKLCEHGITLHGNSITLRPMRETDWDVLACWNSDPELLWFTEGDDVTSRSLDDVQGIYREVSRTAYCFIIEVSGRRIGECWLQEMNIDRILSRYPHRDCRRIDIAIGEKDFWSRGYGTDTIRTLTQFGFQREGADLIFGCGIADYNERSLGAFRKIGYSVDNCVDTPPGAKASQEYDLVLGKQDFTEASVAEQVQVTDE
jgi:aminoglycoside 6'-N-acetyltransferase